MTREGSMNARDRRPATDATRRARLGKVHIAKAQLQLDDDTYRGIIARLFAPHSSAAQLTDQQLGRLIEHFGTLGFKDQKRRPRRSGTRPMADNPMAKKCRALWLSLWHLGAVLSPTEEALAVFVKRTARVDALHWLDETSGMCAIEGLKAMAARAGVDWTRAGLGHWEPYLDEAAREPFAVLSAQWARLIALGVIERTDQPWWSYAAAITGKSAPHFYDRQDWHRAMERFGSMIRRAQATEGSRDA